MAKSTYTTMQGDAWDAIAYRLFGEERLAHILMQANSEHMDVLMFPAGVLLTIPEIAPPQQSLKLPPWSQSHD